MTVSTQTAKSQYTGNGVTTAFTGSFPILDQSHVVVILTSTAGVDTTQTITTDYTISGVGGSTFTVTFVSAPASGVRVTIARNVPVTQELDLVENDEMPSAELEKSYDKLTMIAQQTKESSDRALRIPLSDAASISTTFPGAADRANKLASFDTDGAPAVQDIALLGAVTVPVPVSQGGTGAATAATARDNLGLGELATQDLSDLGDLAAKDVAAIDDIDASGTPSAATFLRGDGTWAAAGNSNYFGTGADGALNTSGSVNLATSTGVNDTGIVVKNYTSITINRGHTVTAADRARAMIL
jgi:hypothetical protein